MAAINDIMESVISCERAKATWTDLVHNFESPSDTKENMIMDMKLEYQTRFVYEYNLISRRYPKTKKALITTPSDSPISTAFFSNNIVHDFQENSDDKADEESNAFGEASLQRDVDSALKTLERNEKEVGETTDLYKVAAEKLGQLKSEATTYKTWMEEITRLEIFHHAHVFDEAQKRHADLDSSVNAMVPRVAQSNFRLNSIAEKIKKEIGH
ncbi:hypothetical protein Tco_1344774 [Tanacetum coccineum]